MKSLVKNLLAIIVLSVLAAAFFMLFLAGKSINMHHSNNLHSVSREASKNRECCIALKWQVDSLRNEVARYPDTVLVFVRWPYSGLDPHIQVEIDKELQREALRRW